jgi:hypothetical protein
MFLLEEFEKKACCVLCRAAHALIHDGPSHKIEVDTISIIPYYKVHFFGTISFRGCGKRQDRICGWFPGCRMREQRMLQFVAVYCRAATFVSWLLKLDDSTLLQLLHSTPVNSGPFIT